jgi:hypothetical protein
MYMRHLDYLVCMAIVGECSSSRLRVGEMLGLSLSP